MNCLKKNTPARVFDSIPSQPPCPDAVVTIGSFDGVHLGHHKIISTLKHTATQIGGEPVVLTFSSHPRKVLYPDKPHPILTTPAEKIASLESLGIRNIILLNFTREIASMDALTFYNEILVKGIGARHIVIGYDHAFGRNREGDVNFLLRMSETSGIHVTRVEEEHLNAKAVSSTWVRSEIVAGNMHMATRLLGREYTLSGIVVKGAGRGGRQLGFPTANIEVDDPDKIIPADGVYAVRVGLPDGSYHQGMLNIGSNPTFDAAHRTIEVNIFDLDRDLYGSEITVEFFHWVRGEIKFGSAQELVAQLEHDRENVLRLLNQEGSAALS